MKLTCVGILALALLAGLAPAPPASARSRFARPPTRKILMAILKKADDRVFYLSRSGIRDLTVTFPKVTTLGTIVRRMHWKGSPDRVLYRVLELPPPHDKVERAYVGQLIAELDGTMYPLVCVPWTEYAEEFEISAPDPADLSTLVLTPKEDRIARFRRKVLEIGSGGRVHRITTVLAPPPPTAEELKADPEFVGREIERLTEIRYQKIGRQWFFRRIDFEGQENRKVIMDIERWKKRGKVWLPVELTLVDPFAGNEVLTPEQIALDTGLADEIFEGFPHRLER